MELNKQEQQEEPIKISLWQQTKSALIKFFKSFTLFEILYFLITLIAITTVSIIFKCDGLSIAFSIIALISVFVLAKGVFIAPIYMIIMNTVYSVQAYYNGLYGEMILNLGILNIFYFISMINWAINKKKNGEIQINHIGWKEWLIIISIALALIVPVYFSLQALGSKYLYLSVATFILPIFSVYLVFRRSVYQFVSFIVQDIFLICIWLMPIFEGGKAELGMLPMALTFTAFIVSNIYGIFNWHRKHREQIVKRELG